MPTEEHDQAAGCAEAEVTASQVSERVRAILAAAEEAAATLRREAEEAAASTQREAEERAEAIRREAEERAAAQLREAEQRAESQVREAEREAQVRLREADTEALRHVNDAKLEADELVAQRTRRISELSDSIIERSEPVLQHLEHAETMRRQLQALVSALSETAERVAREASTAPGVAGGDDPAAREAAMADDERMAEVAPAAGEEGNGAERRTGRFRRSGAGSEELDGARLVALQMAVAGSTRGEVEAHLRQTFELSEPHVVLDDVFGKGSSGYRRVPWSETVDENAG